MNKNKNMGYFTASLIEVMAAQPLDIWKVKTQTRLATNKNLWRALSVTSLHRVFLYMPSIYLSNQYLKDNPYKLFLIPMIVTPHVSYFEYIKTQKQLNRFKTYKVIPNTFLTTYLRESCFIAGMTFLTPAFKNYFGLSDISSSLAASCITTLISQPIDTIKTLQESNSKLILKPVYLWRGTVPRLIRCIWTYYCMNYLR
jgi:hypothetical protein